MTQRFGKDKRTIDYGKKGSSQVDSEIPKHNRRPMEGTKRNDGKAGKAIIAVATAPAKTLGWLTGNQGGKAIVGILAAYCAGLSIEAWYVTMPRVLGDRTQENRKFIPKPFIEDGADLGLLNPLNALPTLWDAAMGVLEAILPFQLKGATPEPVRCVWLDWRFYIAALLSLFLQFWQAKALRSLSIDARKRKALALQKHKRMSLDPQALEIANVKAAEYNQSLMGKRKANGALIFLSYAVEMGTGFGSITQSQGIGILTAGIYCIIQAFGFEMMLNTLQDVEDDDKHND
jgi:hypothetical protein